MLSWKKNPYILEIIYVNIFQEWNQSFFNALTIQPRCHPQKKITQDLDFVFIPHCSYKSLFTHILINLNQDELYSLAAVLNIYQKKSIDSYLVF